MKILNGTVRLWISAAAILLIQSPRLFASAPELLLTTNRAVLQSYRESTSSNLPYQTSQAYAAASDSTAKPNPLSLKAADTLSASPGLDQISVVLTGTGKGDYRIDWDDGSWDHLISMFDANFFLNLQNITRDGNTLASETAFGTNYLICSARAEFYPYASSKQPTDVFVLNPSTNIYKYNPGYFSVGIDALSNEVLYMHKELTTRSNIRSYEAMPYRLHYYGKDKILRIWLRLATPFHYAEDMEYYDIPAIAYVSSFQILDANPQFLNQKLLPSDQIDMETLNAMANASTQRGQAVADGSTRLLLRYQATGPGNVTFEQNGWPRGRLIDVAGSSPFLSAQTTTLFNGKHLAFALYIVPDGIAFQQKNDRNPPSPVTITFTASFIPDSTSIQPIKEQREIILAPTPILLVHGIWGSWLDWVDLFNDLQNPSISKDLIVRSVEYGKLSSRSFFENASIVPNTAAKLIDISRSKGFAATRVDIVAHSMGGILTRIASNLPGYKQRDNFFQGFIRRVITVDTPHHGASSAPFLLSYLAAFSNPLDIIWRMTFIELFHKYPYRGAVWDLDPRTFANSVGGISGAACRPMHIPVYTLHCEASQPGDIDVSWEFLPIYTCLSDLLNKNLMQSNPRLVAFSKEFAANHQKITQRELTASTSFIDVWRTIFDGQANDGTVAVPSQVGRSQENLPSLPGISHVRAPHNTLVRRTIIDLLNDPFANNFDKNGLPRVTQPDLDRQAGWFTPIPKTSRILAAAKLVPSDNSDFVFAQPQESTVVTSGQSVPFSISVADPESWQEILVALKSQGRVWDAIILTNPPFVGTLVCSSNVVGSIELTAIGRNNEGKVHSANVACSTKLAPGTALVSMRTEPLEIMLDGLGETEPIHVIGEFSDKIYRDISHMSANTRFSISNTNIALIDDDGLVKAREQGDTFIEVTNGNITNRIALSIKFRPPEILALWPSSIPFTSQTNILLSISGLRLGGGSKVEVQLDGHSAESIRVINPKVDEHGGFITVELNITQEAQPGAYEVFVTSPAGRSGVNSEKGNILTIQGPLLLEAFTASRQDVGLYVKTIPDRSFTLETSSDLTLWSAISTNVTSRGAWKTNFIRSEMEPVRFFRARLEE